MFEYPNIYTKTNKGTDDYIKTIAVMFFSSLFLWI